MTLNTSIYIRDAINPKQVYAHCGRLIGQHEGIEFTDEPYPVYRDGQRLPDPDGLRWTMNTPGQGLPALLDMKYRESGPIKADAGACDEYCEAPCDGGDHEPDHWIEVAFDTAYGYRDEQGRGCGDLHAAIVAQLGQWLDERGVRWAWQNEFNGEIHGGEDRYDRLTDLCKDGAEATEWFRTTVLPAITQGGGLL